MKITHATSWLRNILVANISGDPDWYSLEKSEIYGIIDVLFFYYMIKMT